MERFNQQIKDHVLLTAALRLLSVTDPRADHVLMLERNAMTRNDPAPFLGIEQIPIACGHALTQAPKPRYQHAGNREPALGRGFRS